MAPFLTLDTTTDVFGYFTPGALWRGAGDTDPVGPQNVTVTVTGLTVTTSLQYGTPPLSLVVASGRVFPWWRWVPPRPMRRRWTQPAWLATLTGDRTCSVAGLALTFTTDVNLFPTQQRIQPRLEGRPLGWWQLRRPARPSQRLQLGPVVPVSTSPNYSQLLTLALGAAVTRSHRTQPVTGQLLTATAGAVVLASMRLVSVTGQSVTSAMRSPTATTARTQPAASQAVTFTLAAVVPSTTSHWTVVVSGLALTTTLGGIGSRTTGNASIVAGAVLQGTSSAVRVLAQATSTAGATLSVAALVVRTATVRIRAGATVTPTVYRQVRGAVTLQGGATLQVATVRPARVDSLYGPFQADQVFGGE